MPKVRSEKPNDDQKPKIRPGITPEIREQQLISLAVDLVEKRLIEGTASSQETTHFLKLASSRTRLEKQKLELEKQKIEEENKLLRAKTKAIEDAADMKELYKDAIDAMRRYSGYGGSDNDDDDEYY